MKKLAIIFCLVLTSTSSPAFWPFTKTKTATLDDHKHSYDQNSQIVDSAVQGEKAPPVNITISGTNNSLSDVHVDGNPQFNQKVQTKASAAGKADSTLDETSSLKVQLPWSIAGILFAVAIVAIIKAIMYARSVSPSVNAAVSVADSGMAKLISRLEGHAAVETDPNKLNFINSILSDANKQRGVINAHNHKKRKAINAH